MVNSNKWNNFTRKRMVVENQKEIVTFRVIPKNKSLHVRVSIGNIICNLLNFKNKDKIKVKFHSHKKNIMLISKQKEDEYNGYSLNTGYSPNCLRFNCVFQSWNDFKLSQTIIVDYEIHSEGNLLVDFSKLNWSK